MTPARTGLAFIGRRSAARHAPIAADTFRFVLQSALQIEHPDLRQPGVPAPIVAELGLDIARFEADRQDPVGSLAP